MHGACPASSIILNSNLTGQLNIACGQHHPAEHPEKDRDALVAWTAVVPAADIEPI
jgi:hypothetical protein